MKDDTQGEFGGVGIIIGIKDNALTVIAPIEDTPAYRAGILAGDRIEEINSNKTEGISIGEAVKHLRGAKGSTVVLKVLRPKTNETKEHTIVREQIKIASVKGTRMLNEQIGYIRIVQFNEPTAGAVQAAVEKLLKEKLRGLILDLRNNPGGLLSSAIEVSEKFLPKGALIVATKGRGMLENQPPAKAGGKYHYTDFPLVILVNNGTASAAEIVAGALQDHKRAVLIGEMTFGKGSVQSLLPLDDGAALRLTTAKYYTPSQRVIHEKGIEPDIVVPMTQDEWQKVLLKRGRIENPEFFAQDKTDPKELANITDRQLDRALDMLKGILIFQARK
jgi:carboxyl-terminal processing protease